MKLRKEIVCMNIAEEGKNDLFVGNQIAKPV